MSEIEDIDKETVNNLASLEINIVSELLDADMDNILNDTRFDEDSLDAVYEAVQLFIEREIEIEDPEEELDTTILDLEDEVVESADEDSPSLEKGQPSKEVTVEGVNEDEVQKNEPITEDME